jgi:hypothetical protein
LSIIVLHKYRVLVQDVTGQQPDHVGSYTVTTQAIPADFLRWLINGTPGQLVAGKNAVPAAQIAGKKGRTVEVKGEGKKSPPIKQKGGARGHKKA